MEENIKKVFYTYEELVLFSTKPVPHQSFLTSKYNGLAHVLRPPHHSITYSTQTSLIVGLNTNISYYISFIDPKFSFLSINPETMPRSLFYLKPNAGQFIMYVKVSGRNVEMTTKKTHQVLSRSNLNREESQCEESEDYKYNECLDRKISSRVGCQTFSTSFPNIPRCSTYEQYTNFSNVYELFVNLEKNELQSESGCLRPCKYMEYKVKQMEDLLKVWEFRNKRFRMNLMCKILGKIEEENIYLRLMMILLLVGRRAGVHHVRSRQHHHAEYCVCQQHPHPGDRGGSCVF